MIDKSSAALALMEALLRRLVSEGVISEIDVDAIYDDALALTQGGADAGVDASLLGALLRRGNH